MNIWLIWALVTGGFFLGVFTVALLGGSREKDQIKNLRDHVCGLESDLIKQEHKAHQRDEIERYILERLDDTVSLWLGGHEEYDRGKTAAYRNLLLKIRGCI